MGWFGNLFRKKYEHEHIEVGKYIGEIKSPEPFIGWYAYSTNKEDKIMIIKLPEKGVSDTIYIVDKDKFQI